MRTALTVVGIIYAIVSVLVAISLLHGRRRDWSVVAVIAALWPFTLPWGMSILRKEDERAQEELFSIYRTTGFDTLVVRNGRWLAGFSVADMDRGGQLVLIAPGTMVAPEDLQEVIAQPYATPQEAIQSSADRHFDWLRRVRSRVEKVGADTH